MPRRFPVMVLVLAFGAACGRPSPPGPAFPDGLDAVMDSFLAAHRVPGAGVALVTSSGTSVRGFGEIRAGSGEPVTPGTVFQAASLGKPVFAYAVHRLVGSGALDLDAPLDTYLRPDRRIEGVTDRVTPRMVLTHTSGLPNWPEGGAEPALERPPGEAWRYSGYGYVLLQHAVEDLLGRPLQRVADSLVFTPLGMESSSYLWHPASDTPAATGHDAAGRPRPAWRPGPEEVERVGVASSFHTSTTDLGLFLSAVLAEGGYLSRASGPGVAVQEELGLEWGLGWAVERSDGEAHLFHWLPGLRPGIPGARPRRRAPDQRPGGPGDGRRGRAPPHRHEASPLPLLHAPSHGLSRHFDERRLQAASNFTTSTSRPTAKV